MDAFHSVTAVAVLPGDEERRQLRRIFSHTNWHLRIAECLREGVAILGAEQVAAVISERDLPDGCWQDLLHDLEQFEVPPRLIVSSRLADDRLWAEVLNMGGYNVLAQPFDSGEVIHVVKHAWLSWKQAWQDRRGKVRRAGGV